MVLTNLRIVGVLYSKRSFVPLETLVRDNLHCRLSDVPSPSGAHVTDVDLPIGGCVVGKDAKEARRPSRKERPK